MLGEAREIVFWFFYSEHLPLKYAEGSKTGHPKMCPFELQGIKPQQTREEAAFSLPQLPRIEIGSLSQKGSYTRELYLKP